MRTCSIDGCARRHKAKGFCGAHYFRFRTYGHPLSGGPERRRAGPCRLVAHRGAKPKALGLCNKHCEKFKKYGDPEREMETVHHKNGVKTDNRSERSEEHTSELQSRQYLVCRLLLEKKNLQSQVF